ncbi:hypothetical protein IM697_22840 [Streptomyces ferrugineus]|uniref:Uncharacterized protein n=1 Tax=Streptomyces ferrugineus TaxID=1413221 RepID=A0A7M2SC96_9ACTN|nr:hypothetical protein [Streptomyces ferrugineus]QOV33108.1 hypothetical protein IM697_22840 [Streptomyces ferrugineus]
MTMPHHALEITLTRPLTPAELHTAACVLPLAANHDATRLMTLVRARTSHRAAHRLRHRLSARLPVDVITTHYPDADGQVLLNVAFPPALHAVIRHSAGQTGQSPERFLQLAVHRALARHTSDEADRLDRAVRELLAHTTSVHLLTAVGRALSRHPGASQP